MSVVWKVRLAAQAELDFSEIITWTLENFGERQAETYAETLILAIEALHDGPEQLGAKARDDIEPGIRTLHVARQGRSGRHFVLFSEAKDALGISRRMVSYYRTAHKAIPRAIWLACLGWEATRPKSKALPRALPTAREYALAHA